MPKFIFHPTSPKVYIKNEGTGEYLHAGPPRTLKRRYALIAGPKEKVINGVWIMNLQWINDGFVRFKQLNGGGSLCAGSARVGAEHFGQIGGETIEGLNP